VKEDQKKDHRKFLGKDVPATTATTTATTTTITSATTTTTTTTNAFAVGVYWKIILEEQNHKHFENQIYSQFIKYFKK